MTCYAYCNKVCGSVLKCIDVKTRSKSVPLSGLEWCVSCEGRPISARRDVSSAPDFPRRAFRLWHAGEALHSEAYGIVHGDGRLESPRGAATPVPDCGRPGVDHVTGSVQEKDLEPGLVNRPVARTISSELFVPRTLTYVKRLVAYLRRGDRSRYLPAICVMQHEGREKSGNLQLAAAT